MAFIDYYAALLTLTKLNISSIIMAQFKNKKCLCLEYSYLWLDLP